MAKKFFADNGMTIIDPCTAPEWMQFVSTHPDAGIFHHPAWLTMLRDVYGYRIFAICMKEGSNIRAGIPFADVQSYITGNRWVSLPFSDYCEPLLPSDEPQCIEKLVDFLKGQLGVATPKIEIRWDIHSRQGVLTAHNFWLHTILLDRDPEVIWRRLNRRSVRHRITKGEREGLIVRECKTSEEFERYYALQVSTRRRLGVPAQPKSFFDAVWKYILAPGLGFALIVFTGDIAIAGGVFFAYGARVSAKYGASDFTYKELHPTHAYLWEGIKKVCAAGYRVFDLGRSDVHNVGLRVFKSEWGTEEHPLGYTFIGNSLPRTEPSKLDNFSSFVIRHSPAFVCRASGQLLYRHFA